MTARRWSRGRFVGLLGLLAGLLSWSGHAANALDEVGALLWEMNEIHTDFGHQSFARGMTPEKLARLADKAAGKLARLRDELEAQLPALDAQGRLARDLARFLQARPGRQAFLDELLREDDADDLGKALAGLASQAPDTRRRWKTPLPFFKP